MPLFPLAMIPCFHRPRERYFSQIKEAIAEESIYLSLGRLIF